MSESSTKLKESIIEAVIELSRAGEIRSTPLGVEQDTYYSIFDLTKRVTAKNNPRQYWKLIKEGYPEVVKDLYNFQFAGRGQRKTPVATLEKSIEIIFLLPGEIAAKLRRLGAKAIADTIKQESQPQNNNVKNTESTPGELILMLAQQLVDHERWKAETQKWKTETDQRLDAIEQKSIDATNELHQLPPSQEPAPPLTERASVRQLVNKWCDATNVNQQIAWRKLYTELYYRDGFSVNARMKKGEYKTKLDLIDKCGKISVLYSIARDIFASSNDQGGSHA
jgi:hypothetical protein